MKVGGRESWRFSKASRAFQQEEKANESLVFISTLFDTRTESSFERFFVSSPFRLLCRFLPLIRPVSTRDTIRPTFPLDPLFSPSPPYLPIPSSFPFFHRSKTMVPRMRDRGSIVSDGFQGVVGRMRRAVKVARKDRAMKSITDHWEQAWVDVVWSGSRVFWWVTGG